MAASPSRAVIDRPPTAPANEKEVAKLLAVVVNRAGSAEDAVRLIRRMVDLAHQQYGSALLEDEHVKGLVVDGRMTAPSRAAASGGLVPAIVRGADVSRSLQVLLNRTGCAISAVRLLQEMARLACQRYGHDVIEDEHIRMMNVDGTLNCISSSFSDETIRSLNGAALPAVTSDEITSARDSSPDLLDELSKYLGLDSTAIETNPETSSRGPPPFPSVSTPPSNIPTAPKAMRKRGAGLPSTVPTAPRAMRATWNAGGLGEGPSESTDRRVVHEMLSFLGPRPTQEISEPVTREALTLGLPNGPNQRRTGSLATDNDNAVRSREPSLDRSGKARLSAAPAASQALAASDSLRPLSVRNTRRGTSGGRRKPKASNNTEPTTNDDVPMSLQPSQMPSASAHFAVAPVESQARSGSKPSSYPELPTTTPQARPAKRKADEMDDMQDEYARGGHGAADTDCPILMIIAVDLMDLANEADLVFPDLVCDRLHQRCVDHDEQRMFVPAQRRPPPLVLQGRNQSNARVNYDPTTKFRLEATLATAYSNKPKDHRLHCLESVLKLFVRWNPTLFPELTESEVGRKKYGWIAPGNFRSVLDVIRNGEARDLSIPSDSSLREAFCSTLFDIVKARMADKCPGSALLEVPKKTEIKSRQKRAMIGNGAAATTKPSRELETSLATPEPEEMQRNFRNTLLDCMVSDDTSVASIEAALDVQLYRIAKLEPRAFPELSDDYAADSSPPPTVLRRPSQQSWNPDLFPELYKGALKPPPTQPGSFLSVLEILSNIDGMPSLPPSSASSDPGNCDAIFRAVQRRVQQKVPDSPLLTYPKPTKDEDDDEQVPDHIKFMLADRTIVHEHNFESTLRGYCKIHASDAETVMEALEALVYELASKEPEAFPELFRA
ncbi:hypothetical protein B0A55_07120 [Friedmanniomyces simplex]|uniref:Uncharacterized protein n=1 Tax=Friedmanniomyces simplex TaxID=329884 RepID=A0A4U0XD39_9PEZI|nr:hypothetical protein B0A55_07120 [Friedmanniomyces simplex]